MKIIIKSEKDVKKKVTLDELKPGTVFKFDNRTVALKLKNDKVVLLNWDDGENWFVISDGTMHHRSIEILGRLDEIIVVKE